MLLGDGFDFGEISVHDDHASVCDLGGNLCRPFDCRRICIQTEEPSIRLGLAQDACGMSAAAQRAVNRSISAAEAQAQQRFVRQDRNVLGDSGLLLRRLM